MAAALDVTLSSLIMMQKIRKLQISSQQGALLTAKRTGQSLITKTPPLVQSLWNKMIKEIGKFTLDSTNKLSISDVCKGLASVLEADH